MPKEIKNRSMVTQTLIVESLLSQDPTYVVVDDDWWAPLPATDTEYDAFCRSRAPYTDHES